MATGLGYFDTEGVWRFGEDDTEVLMSDLWNKGMGSVSTQLALDRARLDDLEDDTGWITPTLTPPWASVVGQTVKYRRLHRFTCFQGRPSGGPSGVAFTLPPEFRPSAEIVAATGNGYTVGSTTRVIIATSGTVSFVTGTTPNLADIAPYAADQ